MMKMKKSMTFPASAQIRADHNFLVGERASEESPDDRLDREYELDEVRDGLKSSRGSRFNLIANELGLESSAHRKFSRETLISGLKDLSRGLAIHPDNR